VNIIWKKFGPKELSYSSSETEKLNGYWKGLKPISAWIAKKRK
jgi:hypothetical protein